MRKCSFPNTCSCNEDICLELLGTILHTAQGNRNGASSQCKWRSRDRQSLDGIIEFLPQLWLKQVRPWSIQLCSITHFLLLFFFFELDIFKFKLLGSKLLLTNTSLSSLGDLHNSLQMAKCLFPPENLYVPRISYIYSITECLNLHCSYIFPFF